MPVNRIAAHIELAARRAKDARTDDPTVRCPTCGCEDFVNSSGGLRCTDCYCYAPPMAETPEEAVERQAVLNTVLWQATQFGAFGGFVIGLLAGALFSRLMP